MTRLRRFLGVSAFWLGWPILFVYLRLGRRTRVLVFHSGSILLVRSWHSPDKWSLPGGGLRRSETAAIGAAREVREETGVTVSPKLLKHLMDGVDQSRGLSYRYTCLWTTLPNKPAPRWHGLEILRAEWVALSDLSSDNTHSSVLDYIARWKQRS